MKTPLTIALLASLLASAHAATTINAVNRLAYGANIGWMDWRGDVTTGPVIGEFVCSGFIYAANVGWINLGSGAPTNGIRYRNLAANDFGVNHDGSGRLEGFAYGANIGWINFTNRDANGAVFEGPRVDLLTGKLNGFLYSANCGWISLSNAFAFVQTDSIQMGPDSDGDGLPDNWEREQAGNLTTLGSGDNDLDGHSNVEEYLADTDPLDPASQLRITMYSATAAGSSGIVTWTSRPTRLYHIQKRTDLNVGFPWIDIGLGSIPPDAGLTTTRMFADPLSPQRFFSVEAVKPLSP